MQKCKSKALVAVDRLGRRYYRNCKRAGAYQGYCYQHVNGQHKTGRDGFVRRRISDGKEI